MKLKPDNTFIIQMIMAENSLYRIKGNKMFTTFKRGPKGITSTDTSTIEIKDNSLINTVIKDSKTETIIMHKVRGSRNKKSIVGDYARKYPNGHNAFSRFTKNGRWIFRVPLQKITGNYSIKDSIITFNYKSPQQYTEKRKFRFKSKSLILKTDKTNTDEIYNKVDYFPED